MKEKILQLRKLGKSYNAICSEVGCCKATVSYYCAPTGKEKNRVRTNAERKKIRRELKAEHGGKCIICGYDRCLTSLIFHHPDPSIKELNVSTLINSKGKRYAYEEAKKCVLVCANCHGEIHEGIISIPNQANLVKASA